MRLKEKIIPWDRRERGTEAEGDGSKGRDTGWGVGVGVGLQLSDGRRDRTTVSERSAHILASRPTNFLPVY